MLKVRIRCDCHSVTLAEREVLSQIIRIKLQHLEKKMNREKKTSNSFTQKTYKNTTETFSLFTVNMFIYSSNLQTHQLWQKHTKTKNSERQESKSFLQLYDD